MLVFDCKAVLVIRVNLNHHAVCRSVLSCKRHVLCEAVCVTCRIIGCQNSIICIVKAVCKDIVNLAFHVSVLIHADGDSRAFGGLKAYSIFRMQHDFAACVEIFRNGRLAAGSLKLRRNDICRKAVCDL